MSESLLADTHVLKWYFDGDPRIGDRARRHLDRAFEESALVASAVSLYEFEQLLRIRRFRPFDIEGWLRRTSAAGLAVLPLDAESAIDAGRLPGNPPDNPFDRMIIATSRVHELTLATRDGEILDYGAAGNVRTLEV